MAVEKINMRNDILPGNRLELVPANAETCDHEDREVVTEVDIRHVSDLYRPLQSTHRKCDSA